MTNFSVKPPGVNVGIENWLSHLTVDMVPYDNIYGWGYGNIKEK